MNHTAFESIAERIDERPRCLACGTLIDAVPEAETFRRRGAFALVVQWRICACGAFARTQRVRKAADAVAATAQETAVGA
jgi:ribosomal protein L37E